jgi:hypothetical protein
MGMQNCAVWQNCTDDLSVPAAPVTSVDGDDGDDDDDDDDLP